MVETRASGAVEGEWEGVAGSGGESGGEGSSTAAAAAAAAAVEKAVEKAKKKARAEKEASLPSNTPAKKRRGLVAGAMAQAARQERVAQKKAAENAKENEQRMLGYLGGNLKRKQGQTLVEPEVRSMLFEYYHLQAEEGLSPSKAAQRVAREQGIGSKTVHTYANSFESNGGKIIVKDGAGRGGVDKSSLLPETQLQIELWIEAKHKGSPVYAREIWRWLQSDPPNANANSDAGEGEGEEGGGAEEGGGEADECASYDVDRCAIEVSEKTVGNWLAKMGYKHGRAGVVGYTRD